MRTVLITGARAPVALHLVRLFGQAGYRVVLADSLSRPVSRASRFVDRYVQLPAPRWNLPDYAQAVRALCAQEAPALVIPTCEEVFYLAQIKPQIADLPLFAPDIDLLSRAHHKADFIDMVRAMALPAPETRLLTSRKDLKSLTDPNDWVVKPVWSRFATQALIPPHTRALQNVKPTGQTPWVAQRFVQGQEICVYAVAVKGRLVACSAYTSGWRAGRGAGIYLEPHADRAAQDFAKRFVKATGWTGQISFDLIRQADGQIMPIECNPRTTSGVHFFNSGLAFVSALLGGDAVAPDGIDPATVKLAMWVYAMPSALLKGRLRDWRRDMSRATDILRMSDDPRPARAQWAALIEIVLTAIRQRVSLQKASTHDIEWNGPDRS